MYFCLKIVGTIGIPRSARDLTNNQVPNTKYQLPTYEKASSNNSTTCLIGWFMPRCCIPARS